MKGVISFVFQYGFGYNISKYFGIFFIAIMILPLSYVVINNSHLKKTSEVFFYSVFVFLGLAFSILSKDANLLHSSFVIFGLPVVLSWVKGIDDSTIFYLFGIFFKFTIFFILIEACVIHLGLFGRISYDEIIDQESVKYLNANNYKPCLAYYLFSMKVDGKLTSLFFEVLKLFVDSGGSREIHFYENEELSEFFECRNNQIKEILSA